MKHWIIENRDWLIGLITGVFGWFGGRKLKKANEKSAELENIEKVREIEKKLLEDMGNRISELIKYNDYLEGVVEEIKRKLVKYVDKYGELEDE